VKIVSFEGKHKIADKWEEDVYTVLKQPNPTISMYVVRKDSGEGRKRTLHRNLLLPIGHLDSFQKSDTRPEPNLERQEETTNVKNQLRLVIVIQNQMLRYRYQHTEVRTSHTM
jgi:hypothetical protein